MGRPVELVRDLWEAYAAGGIDGVARVAGDGVIWQPFVTDGRVLRGSDELREAFAALAADGVRCELALQDIEEHGSAVLATGTVRVHRNGGVEEATRCWAYHFYSGRLRRQTTYPTRDEAVETIAALRALNEAPFAIAEEEDGDAGDRVIHLSGELDVATAPDFERVVLRHRPPHQRVVLDLGQLRFMDSTGLRILLQARRVANEGSWELVLRSVPPPIRRLFELSGVQAAFATEPVDAAIDVGD
jgi:anti-anti-sigma factor